jgi:hypothetical protein
MGCVGVVFIWGVSLRCSGVVVVCASDPWYKEACLFVVSEFVLHLCDFEISLTGYLRI